MSEKKNLKTARVSIKKSSDTNTRRRKLTKKQQNRQAKYQASQLPKLPSSFRLLSASYKLIIANYRLMLGIVGVYLILNVLLVRGLSGGIDVQALKGTLRTSISGNLSGLVGALGIFGALVGSSGTSGSESASIIQTFLVILESMVIIYCLRKLFARKIIGIKQAYYNSTAQLVPFVLTALVIVAQLLPMAIAAGLYQIVIAQGIAVGGIETLIWLVLFILLSLWSIRMISSSIFALYIVTLPDMTPFQALAAAKKTVAFRRLKVIRKLLFLPVVIFAICGLIVIPLIIFVSVLAEPVFYVLATTALVFVHVYIYHLYRELI